MKRLAVLIALIALVPGCQCWHQFTADVASQTTGLNRTVTVYDYNGRTLGTWTSKTVIDAERSGITTFFDSTGHRVLVNGGTLYDVPEPPRERGNSEALPAVRGQAQLTKARATCDCEG